MLLNLLRGFNVQDALDAPRFCISPGLPDAPVKDAKDAGNINSEVYFEPGISEATLQKLRGTHTLCVWLLLTCVKTWVTMLVPYLEHRGG